MDKIKIILDTDIGTDIDDALALAYLLMKPECELMGITTVTGEAKTRAKLASVICKAANRGDIPIYPGNEECILIEHRWLPFTGRSTWSISFRNTTGFTVSRCRKLPLMYAGTPFALIWQNPV